MTQLADRNAGRIPLFDQQRYFLDEWSHLIMPWGLSITARNEIWVGGSSPQAWYRDGRYPPPKDPIFMRFSTDGKVRQLDTVPGGAGRSGATRRMQLAPRRCGRFAGKPVGRGHQWQTPPEIRAQRRGPVRDPEERSRFPC